MGKTNKTFSINDEYLTIFEERRAELGMTVTSYFEHLIDTEHKKAQAATPVEVIKDNPKHIVRIAELETALADAQENYDHIKENFNKLASDDNIKKSNLSIEIEALKQENATLQATLQASRFVADGETPLNLDPINIKILEYVADREGKRRNQEWTISDVINWFVHYRFEHGTLNGGFNSVPDRVINKMRKEFEEC